MNCKTVNKMPITVEFFVGPTIKQYSKKHIMFLFKVSRIGCDQFTEKGPKWIRENIQLAKAQQDKSIFDLQKKSGERR